MSSLGSRTGTDGAIQSGRAGAEVTVLHKTDTVLYISAVLVTHVVHENNTT